MLVTLLKNLSAYHAFDATTIAYEITAFVPNNRLPFFVHLLLRYTIVYGFVNQYIMAIHGSDKVLVCTRQEW